MKIYILLLALRVSACYAITCPPTPTCPPPTDCLAAVTCPPCAIAKLAPIKMAPRPTGPSGIYCNESEKCVGQPDGTMFPDNGSTGYIVCQCECDILMPCPAGTAFDDHKKVCDHIPSPCPLPPECPAALPCPQQECPPCDEHSEAGPSGIACHTSKHCVDQPDGAMFPLEGKNGFIVCQCECDIERPCAEGTAYDSDLKTCAFINQNYKRLSQVHH
uniref:Chitin-binding type-2 domain-containing protein n=1 Tax=Glossina morsitans morsitans TaxID=37546 RepID=A0A1B0G920_GLOMM